MQIFKFGGASVKDADAIRNVAKILGDYKDHNLVLVISAMGKTTNALEKLCLEYFNKQNFQGSYDSVRDYHYSIAKELFPDKNHKVYTEINNLFVELDWILEEEPNQEFDFIYDQIVSLGELLSSKTLSAYLNEAGIRNRWEDVRNCIKTDNTYREGKVDWDHTITETRSGINFSSDSIIVTQGFIGSTSENYTTTLGREGSDYTAAILAYALDAEKVVIWKDVPGVLNADPKWYKNTVKMEQMSYYDAIELAYYGASVIHPKTIKPLQNKNIPLYVKSFLAPKERGTIISEKSQTEPLIPSFIFKSNQVLLSISAKDFSFIVEENIGHIFKVFAELGVKVNLMQNSAISFSVCIDHPEYLNSLIDHLKKEYKVLFNDKLELFTIRHYDQKTIDFISEGKEILVEQKSRHTVQLVVKNS